MKLRRLSYQSTTLAVKELLLDDCNFVVGRNGSGKSRLLTLLDNLVGLLNNTLRIHHVGRWELEFVTNDDQPFVYTFAIKGGDVAISAEKIMYEGRQVLFRHKDSNVSILNNLTGKQEIFQVPLDKLTILAVRDVKKFPALELLADCANHSFGFRFANISPYGNFADSEYELLTRLPAIPTLFKQLSEDSKQGIVHQLQSLDYPIIDIGYQKSLGRDVIRFKLKDQVYLQLPDKMSQGAVRATALLIFLEYLTTVKKGHLVVIDDLCEGLDYERAKLFGKMIFDLAKRTGIQLLATTNDRNLINVVDLDNIIVVESIGEQIVTYSRAQNPEAYEHFVYTGLSNFDFFTTGYFKEMV